MKRNEKTTPFDVNVMRSQVLYRVAHVLHCVHSPLAAMCRMMKASRHSGIRFKVKPEKVVMSKGLIVPEPLVSLLMLDTAYLRCAVKMYTLCVPLQLRADGYA